jgi:hypothetical protein
MFVSEVEQIEKRIGGLSPEDLAQFRAWFLVYDARAWDRQIEGDSKAGRLDGMIAEALAEYEAGKVHDLDAPKPAAAHATRLDRHPRELRLAIKERRCDESRRRGTP